MGYKLTSLVNLPIDENVELYIFSVGDQLWEGGLFEIVNRNFDKIARAIGPNAIIVGGLTDEFHGEVVKNYLGRNHQKLKNLMPALLITDAHPEKLSDESLRVVIPLREVHERYEIIDNFFSDLASLARGEDDNLLRALERAPQPNELVDDVIEVKVPIIPGVVAVNINHAIGNLREWFKKQKEARERFAGA